MRRPLLLGYGLVVYAVFGATFVAMLDFLAQTGSLRGIDTGRSGPTATALAVDLALIAAFGVTHSVLARAPVKGVLTRVIPPAAERSTYVLVASVMLGLLVWHWRALPAVVWHVDMPRGVYLSVQAATAVLIFYATLLTNHLDLFGVRQVWLAAYGRAYTPVPFVEKSLYRHVRHPMMLAFLLWMWLTPHMTEGHLLFAAGMTVYIWVGVAFEQRALARELGAPYIDYCRRVPALVPMPRGSQRDRSQRPG